jgi:UDP-N-acetylmuramoyl-L-alanyl-D-glutamate--2,6-diaminopimelate ligase
VSARGPRTRARVSSEPVARSLPHVRLADVAAVVPGAETSRDAVVVDAAFDAGEVAPDALFFCVPGARADGHAFAHDAHRAGAAALVVERWLDDVDLPQVRVPSVREAMGPMSAVVFGYPAATLSVVGVTGTNGKTTVTYLLESVFSAAGWSPGVIGTTGARIDGAHVPLARTTPEAPDLHRLLARMRDDGVRVVAVEVSSHALAYARVDGLVFDVALFTNLSQDHLDLHRSMERYFETKARLFTPEHAREGVANADDPWCRRLLDSASIPVSSYAVDTDASLRATSVEVTPHGIAFRVGDLAVSSALLGRFNVANCLGVVAVTRALGIDDESIATGIASVSGVPGRVEPIEAGQGFLVVVDYAHTPDSIGGVLQAARPLGSGRLIVVFGCGGDRDRAKRPLMGAAATSEADLSVITTDNPRSEDPLSIITDVERGASAGGGAYAVEPDRRAAIRLALHEAHAGDVVVIAGRGHESVQELDGSTVPFDDREVAREELLALEEEA